MTNAAANSGYGIAIAGRGSFLIRVHLCCDLKALKGLNGLKSSACKDICVFCNCPGDQCSICNLDAEWQTRDRMDCHATVLGVPLCRVHPCILHATCRITEKLLHVSFTQRIWNTMCSNPAIGKVMVDRFLHFMNNIIGANGGTCQVSQRKKHGVMQLCKIPLSGPECRLIMEKIDELVNAVNDPDPIFRTGVATVWQVKIYGNILM